MEGARRKGENYKVIRRKYRKVYEEKKRRKRERDMREGNREGENGEADVEGG